MHLYAYAGRYNAPLVGDTGVARKSRISIREDDDDDDDDDGDDDDDDEANESRNAAAPHRARSRQGCI